jgi:hypothetical protein
LEKASGAQQQGPLHSAKEPLAAAGEGAQPFRVANLNCAPGFAQSAPVLKEADALRDARAAHAEYVRQAFIRKWQPVIAAFLPRREEPAREALIESVP